MKLLCLLLIASCSSYFPPVRGQYTLTTKKHFMFSNMYVNPSNLESTPTHILINYDVIVKNIDKKAHDIDLTESLIRIDKNTYHMKCESFKDKAIKFSLMSEAQARILCVGKLDKKIGANNDYRAILEIPLDQDKAKFEYLIRAEDFK